MDRFSYPTQYELREVLSSITNRSFLNTFAQRKGIFITNVTLDKLAIEIAELFLDEDDLELIRAEAYQYSSNNTLSGFTVKSPNANFSLRDVYQDIFENGERKPGLVLNALVKVSNEVGVFKGSLEYNRKRPGRIQFLQDEINSFTFYLKDLGNQSWQVEIDGNRSTDLRELQKLLEKGLRREDEFEELEQKNLTSDKAVLFFDELAKQGMSEDWLFEDVKHLTLKMGSDVDEEELVEVSQANEEQLLGISQAILQGKNLRENPFVQQSVKNGYRFSAMTYEFSHKSDPITLNIKAEFKGRPKVFEVSIGSVFEKSGSAAKRVLASLSEAENRRIRSQFWNNSKVCYHALVS